VLRLAAHIEITGIVSADPVEEIKMLLVEIASGKHSFSKTMTFAQFDPLEPYFQRQMHEDKQIKKGFQTISPTDESSGYDGAIVILD